RRTAYRTSASCSPRRSRPRSDMVPAGYIPDMESAFEVLAEPRRRAILDLLRAGERPVGELVEKLSLSQPAVSKHLKVLRDAGLVEVRQDAQRRWYRLSPAPLAEIDAWRGPD